MSEGPEPVKGGVEGEEVGGLEELVFIVSVEAVVEGEEVGESEKLVLIVSVEAVVEGEEVGESEELVLVTVEGSPQTKQLMLYDL